MTDRVDSRERNKRSIRRDRESAVTDGFANRELEHGRRQRIDPRVVMSAAEQSAGMNETDLSALDPGPAVARLLVERDARVLFAGAGASKTVARLADPPPSIAGAPVAATVSVESEIDFTVGTIVMRPPDRVDGLFDTSRVFDLRDGVTQDLRLVGVSAVNLRNRYIWARICGRGLYAAVMLPIDLASLVALTTLKTLALPMARASERERLATARSVTRAVQRSLGPSTAGRRRVSHHEVAVDLRRHGTPAPVGELELEHRAGREIAAGLDRLAGRFAANPLIPEIQILLDLDRARSTPWFG
jgi:hypothetical protein